MKEKEDFWVECNVCKDWLLNWVGSTPCCGSIAWLIEDNKPVEKIMVFGLNSQTDPIILNNNNDV